MLHLLKESKLSFNKMMHAHTLIKHPVMQSMNVHGVNQLQLKVLAKLLKWQRLFQLASLHVINSKKKNQLRFKIHALMQIKHLVMLLMNVHGANQLQLKVLAKLLKWQRLFPPASLHAINSKKKFQLRFKIHALMQIRHLVML